MARTRPIGEYGTDGDGLLDPNRRTLDDRKYGPGGDGLLDPKRLTAQERHLGDETRWDPQKAGRSPVVQRLRRAAGKALGR